MAAVAVPRSRSFQQFDPNGELFSGELLETARLPPYNSTFVDGWLAQQQQQQPAGSDAICGGLGDSLANSSDQVSLCQTLACVALG